MVERVFQDPVSVSLDTIQSSVAGGNLACLVALRRLALEQSLPVYLVGGPVRDALLGTPLKDLDFVVEGDAPQLGRQLADELGAGLVVHPRFGTATVILKDCHVDLVMARQESYARPGALPLVSPGTIHDDLARRDFSVNALALPLAGARPRLLDLHGGVKDLQDGLIRILHRDSFRDDATRLLRAVRYEQRLGFRLEEETLVQLREAVAQGCLDSISGDRLRHELERTMEEAQPRLALQRAIQLGILPAVHPSLAHADDLAPVGVLDCPQGARAASPAESGAAPLTYLAALVYRLSPEEGEAVVRRLNLPNSWATVVRDSIQLHQREQDLAAPSLARSQLWGLLQGLAPASVLAVARLTDSPLVADRLKVYLQELRFVRPLLNGQDLIHLGATPGPLLGRVLAQLHRARLDQRVSTEAEERLLARELLDAREGEGHRG